MADSKNQLLSSAFKPKRIFIIYLVLIHLLLALFVYKLNLLPRVLARFSGGVVENTHLYDVLLPYHGRMDGSVPDGAIVFLGDSIVQALVTSAVADKTINYGIGADTTGGLAARLPVYSSLDSSRAIVISIGVNDLWYRQHDEIVPLYEQLLSALPRHIPVIANALFPVAEGRDMAPGTNARIIRLNDSLKHIVSRYPDVAFVDNRERFVDSDGQLKADYHIGDGLHLSTNGYQAWIKILKHELSQVAALQVD